MLWRRWTCIPKALGNESPAFFKARRLYFLYFNFIVDLNFYFPLFWGMVMYVNEFKTEGNKIETKDKIEPQHILYFVLDKSLSHERKVG